MTMLEASIFGRGGDVTLWTVTELFYALFTYCNVLLSMRTRMFMRVVGQACTLHMYVESVSILTACSNEHAQVWTEQATSMN